MNLPSSALCGYGSKQDTLKTGHTPSQGHKYSREKKKKHFHNHMCTVCFLTQEETGGKKICFGYSLMLVGPVAG